MILLCNAFTDFFTRLGMHLSNPVVIIALILAILGGGLGLASDRIVCAIKHIDHTEDGDKMLTTFKVISVVLLFFAILLLIFR